MNPEPNKAKEIFERAIEIESHEERTAFVRDLCGDDSALQDQVEGLMRAYSEAGSFLDPPTDGMTATSDLAEVERPGTEIGRYKLLQQIGEGGFGVVYMAEQTQPVTRKVALKIIKPGMDSKQVIARFEAERQALALMEHPNIARVHDAGSTATGRPYFVMELVKGLPITKFCDEQQLTPEKRLELFIPVCNAIQHAHQKGIIHRDIKPSNILISMYDGQPVPKVIDFGIAKAIGQQLTEKTMFTQYGQVIGTLEYMSPEQAELNQLDIDTRADVYSLGAVLYELLTGSTPIERKRLRSAAFDEILRIIREEEPPQPSRRLSTTDELASVSAQRRVEPARLTRLVRGDLDWIVMKALDKERGRRYETANGLGRDIQRYLAHEPVEASPPDASYRLRKFVRKHKASLSVAATIGIILLVTTAISISQAIQARKSAKDATNAALETKAEQQRTLDAKNRAEEAEQENLAQLVSSHIATGTRFMHQRSLGKAALFFAEAYALDAHNLDAAQLHEMRCSTAIQACAKPANVWNAGAEARNLVLSPSGQYLITFGDEDAISTAEGEANLWSTATGTLLGTFNHAQTIVCAAFSADEALLATGSADATARIWEVRTGQPISPPLNHEFIVSRVEFSHSGERLFTSSGSYSRTTELPRAGPYLKKSPLSKVWKVSTAELVTEFELAVPIRDVAFSPDDSRLAFAEGALIHLYDLSSLERIRTWPISEASYVRFADDGSLIGAGYGGGAGRERTLFYDVESGTRLGDQTGRAIDSHGGGSQILARDGDDFVTFERSNELVVRRIAKPGFENADLDPSCRFVSATLGSELQIWDVWRNQEQVPPIVHGCHIAAHNWLPDGRKIITLDAAGIIRVWDLATSVLPGTRADVGHFVRTDYRGLPPRGYGASFSPEQSVVSFTSSSPDGHTVEVWDFDKPQRKWAIEVDWEFRPAKVAPSHRYLAAASRDAIQLWDITTGKNVITLAEKLKANDAITFSPDSRLFAVAGENSKTKVVSTSDGATICELPSLSLPVRHLAFSPDSSLLVVASGDYEVLGSSRGGLRYADRLDRPEDVPRGVVRIYRIPSGQEYTSPLEHSASVNWTDFDASGRLLATACRDFVPSGCTAQVWDLRTGKLVSPKLKHQSPVSRVVFAAGDRLITTSDDGTARIWDYSVGREVVPPMESDAGWTAFGLRASQNDDFLQIETSRHIQLCDPSSGQPATVPIKRQLGAAIHEGRTLVVADENGFRSSPVTHLHLTPEEFQLYASVVSGLQLAAGGSVVSLGAEDYLEAYRALSQHSSSLAASKSQIDEWNRQALWWHFHRARYLGYRNWHLSHFHADQILRRSPADSSSWTHLEYDALTLRGMANANLNDFTLALLDFERASKSPPRTPRVYEVDSFSFNKQLAQLQLVSGRVAEHKRTCESMLEKFETLESPSMSDAGYVLRACVYGASAFDDWTRLRSISEAEYNGYQISTVYRRPLMYRLGEYSRANDYLNPPSINPSPRIGDSVGTARKLALESMMSIRFGDTDLAENKLNEAKAIFAATKNGDRWEFRVEALLMIKEAEGLLGPLAKADQNPSNP